MLRSRGMAVVQPFRAVRYDETSAGPLDSLVAPPYDVISADERERARARNPHNVVHLTLPDSEEQAARDLASWRDERRARARRGAHGLGADAGLRRPGRRRTPARGVRRLAPGRAVRARRRAPARAHARRARRRSGSGCCGRTRTQLEPIFLLYDGPPPVRPPDRAPDLQAEGTRLWRVEGAADAGTAALAETQLLIADGHHRYETALAFHAEQGTPESALLMVVLVSTSDPGLRSSRRTGCSPRRASLSGERLAAPSLEAALAELEAAAPEAPATIEVTQEGVHLVTGRPGQLDVELVDRWAMRASRTRRTRRRRCDASPSARPRSPISCDRCGSRTCSRSPAAARCCRRRARTSFPSSSRGCSCTRCEPLAGDCRAAAADVVAVLAALPTRLEREPVLRRGRGRRRHDRR